jgi:hypothetical protein
MTMNRVTGIKAKKGSKPNFVASIKQAYPPRMAKDPWAKLTISMTPKIRVRPKVIRIYREERKIPVIKS